MEVVILFILVFLLLFLGFLAFRLGQWIFAVKKRLVIFLALIVAVTLGEVINQVFFKKMEFVQSQVYLNLYLVKNPVKDPMVRNQSIREKAIEYLKSEIIGSNKPVYISEQSVLFYEYSKGFQFNIFQDAGTAYFLENEEDLGGFVSEELGMYTQYRLAEFYFDTCETDSTYYCGDVSYFDQGEFVKEDRLSRLVSVNHKTQKNF
ncbi:hypothetical protein [Reichenbachiella ulvae]|uniref:Uncharacterized protein n=1 Tax=Reichenbachiella ulvae TaxID=2980104 RepID=A0ABT3CUM0_9BACT|nr:hypothetical protein [Reichenbachiella ulvae]MCV9387396.1 hypothetical protein [Reichenbachiella ulvae]